MARNNHTSTDAKSHELGDPFAKPPDSDEGKFAEAYESASGSREDIEAEPRKPSKHEDYGSTDDHVFTDPRVAGYWMGVYEKATYEGRHRFDPHFTWSAEEELALKRKIDWRIITWAWMMFVSPSLQSMSIEKDLKDAATCEWWQSGPFRGVIADDRFVAIANQNSRMIKLTSVVLARSESTQCQPGNFG